MRRALLFDLGGTLAAYYHAAEWPAVLTQGLAACAAHLTQGGLAVPPADEVTRRGAAENHEAADHQVRPLALRLAAIFDLPLTPPEVVAGAVEAFMLPILKRRQVYPDAHAALSRALAQGYRLGLLSNTPWGSPPHVWQRELDRLGLAEYFAAAVFCGDVGWRKPHPAGFLELARRLGAPPDECVYIGDDPRWDVVGARGAGMRVVLLKREGPPHPRQAEMDRAAEDADVRIRGLHELDQALHGLNISNGSAD